MLDGRLLSHARKSYSEAGLGRYVLTTIRVETARPGDPQHPNAIEVRFNNIHVLTRRAK